MMSKTRMEEINQRNAKIMALKKKIVLTIKFQ